MGSAGVGRPPYFAVVQIWAWATARWHYVDGRLALVGLDPATMPAWRLLNVLFVLMVECVGEINRDQVVEEFEKQLATPPFPDRETWGLPTADRVAASATLAQYGPPTGWRPPTPKE